MGQIITLIFDLFQKTATLTTTPVVISFVDILLLTQLSRMSRRGSVKVSRPGSALRDRLQYTDVIERARVAPPSHMLDKYNGNVRAETRPQRIELPRFI